MAGSLRGEGITKVFPGGARALDGVSFSVDAGRVLTLLGPSGCGKSTLLRIVAGLETATSGSLTLDGASLADVPAGRRDVGFVFQNYALYPHLSVERNLSLALETRKVPRAEISSRVGEAAKLLGLAKLLDRRPRQLSGGEQQRVALARAFVVRPAVLLADEPTGSLDFATGERVMELMFELNREAGTTLVMVTHDQAIASRCDRQLHIEAGRLRRDEARSVLRTYLTQRRFFGTDEIKAFVDIGWNGTIQSNVRTTIGSRLTANIVSIAVNAGDSVRKGDVLVQLDDRDVRARSEQSRKAVRATSTNLSFTCTCCRPRRVSKLTMVGFFAP